MKHYDAWVPYTGNSALILAAVLVIVTGIFVYLGFRLKRTVGVARPGKLGGAFLIVVWILSFFTFVVSVGAYGTVQVEQYGVYTPSKNPISPITFLCGLTTFILIIVLNRRQGLKVAFWSAVVGTIAAPMIFELPFDLIVMSRVYAPQPYALYVLLFFLPLFLWEIASFSLLSMSPLMKISKYTLFSLAAMFLVFSVWALLGFYYPAQPVFIALNAVSKVLCFVASITLFFPQKEGLLDKAITQAELSRAGSPTGGV